MRVLAFDTALSACSAAVYDSTDDSVLASERAVMDKGHAEALPLMVARVMAEARVGPSGIDRIAVTIGPGTFTGVRIGLSFALGLGVATVRPIVGVSTLEAIAANLDDDRDVPIAAAIDARRGNLYLQLFSGRLEMLTEPSIVSLESALAMLPGRVRTVGTAAPLLASAAPALVLPLDQDRALPDARVVARLGAAKPPPAHPPEPLYLRPPDAQPAAAFANGMRIVAVESAHAGVLAELHGECFARPWDVEAFARLMAMPGSLAIVATSEGGEPLGFLFARRAADTAEILTLGVRPSQRRRQLATRLVRHAASSLAAAGAGSLFIEVAEFNEAAVALYEKLGFARVGIRKDYYDAEDGAGRNAMTMALPLRIA